VQTVNDTQAVKPLMKVEINDEVQILDEGGHDSEMQIVDETSQSVSDAANPTSKTQSKDATHDDRPSSLINKDMMPHLPEGKAWNGQPLPIVRFAGGRTQIIGPELFECDTQVRKEEDEEESN
jgi:hypothetical protein